MTHALVIIGLSLVPFVAAVAAGFAIHKHHDRLRLAFDVLRGRVSLRDDGRAFRCDRRHVEANQEVASKDELALLRRAANELTFALGYITNVGKVPEYAAAVEKVIDKK